MKIEIAFDDARKLGQVLADIAAFAQAGQSDDGALVNLVDADPTKNAAADDAAALRTTLAAVAAERDKLKLDYAVLKAELRGVYRALDVDAAYI